MDFTFVGAMLKAKLASPPWLPQLAGNPQVEANCLRVFQAFTNPEDGSPALKSRIQAMLGILPMLVQTASSKAVLQ